MPIENHIIKDATCAENVTNWQWLCAHILNIYNLRRNIAWSTTTHKQILGFICYRRQTKVDYYRLFTQYYVLWFQVSMNYVFSRHLAQPSKHSFHNKLTLVLSVLLHIIHASANWSAFNIFQGKINWILRLINTLQFHKIGMVE